VIAIASILGADPTAGSSAWRLYKGLRFVLKREVCQRDLDAEPNRLSVLDGRSRKQNPHPSSGRQYGWPFSNLTSLPSPFALTGTAA
jgi:hypothetical protein